MSTKSSKEAPSSRAQEIMEMFATIPVEMLKTKGLELLNATRHVSMGRDRAPVIEPDNAVRLRVWQTIVEQSAGAAGTRKPVDAAPVGGEDKPGPGLLVKRRASPAADSAPESPAA